jgi:cyclopropane fatty-acyl-phospholipid synthase-like methyltransferase
MGIDLACGEGYWTHLFAQKCKEMHGCDISENAIKRAIGDEPLNVAFFQKDMTRIKDDKYLNKHEYDLVILMDALYYVKPENWKDVAEGVYSLLKEGGTFIICNGQYFDEADIRDIFKKIDWEVIITSPFKLRTHCEYYVLMKGVYVPDKKMD